MSYNILINKFLIVVNVNDIKGKKFDAHGLLLMAYTCNVCQAKQARTFSKYAYKKGVVLIRCEGCDSLHLIADNLGWFRDDAVNIEQIMKEKGESIRQNFTEEAIEFVQKDDQGNYPVFAENDANMQ